MSLDDLENLFIPRQQRMAESAPFPLTRQPVRGRHVGAPVPSNEWLNAMFATMSDALAVVERDRPRHRRDD